MGTKKSASSEPPVKSKLVKLPSDVHCRLLDLAAKFHSSENDQIIAAIVKYWEAEFPERRK